MADEKHNDENNARSRTNLLNETKQTTWKGLISDLVRKKESWVMILGTLVLLLGYFAPMFKFLRPKLQSYKVEMTITRTVKQHGKEIQKQTHSTGLYKPTNVYNTVLQGLIYFMGSIMVALILRIKLKNLLISLIRKELKG